MNYQARKVRLTCSESVVREWAAYMVAHLGEVKLALKQEKVRHEMWFMGHDTALFIIGVMDVTDKAASVAVSNKSQLSVDEVHRKFKVHWDRSRIEELQIDLFRVPKFGGCEFLFEAYSD